MHPTLQYLVLQEDFSNATAILQDRKEVSNYDIARDNLNRDFQRAASYKINFQKAISNLKAKANSSTNLVEKKEIAEAEARLKNEIAKTNKRQQEIKEKLATLPKKPIVKLGDPVRGTETPTIAISKPPVVELGDPVGNGEGTPVFAPKPPIVGYGDPIKGSGGTPEPEIPFCATARCPQGTKCSNADKACVPVTPVVDTDINVVITDGDIEDAGTTGELDTIISGGGGYGGGSFIEPTADMINSGQGGAESGAGASSGAAMHLGLKKDSKYILPLVLAASGLVFAIVKPIK